jgi:hypothetical protein
MCGIFAVSASKRPCWFLNPSSIRYMLFFVH